MNTRVFHRATRGILLTLAVCTLLVGSHQGEFWPFSIFPMFSRAGQPWTRAVVRQVPDHTPGLHLWEPVGLADLPGQPLRLEEQGLSQNDIANFVSKTAVWDERRLNGLRRLLEVPRMTESLLVYRVQGQLDQNSVQITAMPLILFTPDSTFTAPSLGTSLAAER